MTGCWMTALAVQNSAAVILLGAVTVVVVLVLLLYGKLWIQGWLANSYTPMSDLIGMTLRGRNARVVVECRIMATAAGLSLDNEMLEAHCLAGGNIRNLVRAMIEAEKAGRPLDFRRGAALDLSDVDVLEFVRSGASYEDVLPTERIPVEMEANESV